MEFHGIIKPDQQEVVEAAIVSLFNISIPAVNRMFVLEDKNEKHYIQIMNYELFSDDLLESVADFL